MRLQSSEATDVTNSVAAVAPEITETLPDRAELDALLASAAAASRKRALTTRRLRVGVITLLVVSLAATAFTSFVKHRFDWDMFNLLNLISLVGIATGVGATQKNVAKSLAQYDDLRCVGFLAEALEYGDKEIADIAANSLINLLPRMQPADAALLEPPQRECLRRALIVGTSKFKEPLAIAILKALERIGDDRDTIAVTRLANSADTQKYSDGLRSAAHNCLDALQIKAEENERRNTLLRPGSISAPADQLLRPVQSTDASDELLRAHNGE